jgi:hypothetical protein
MRSGSALVKRRLLYAVLACTAASSIPVDFAAADPVEVIHTQLIGGNFNTCNGELVFFTGEARIIQRFNADGSFSESFSAHGKGTGLRGNEYVLPLFKTLLVRDSAGFLTLDDERQILVSKGPAPNQDVRFYFSSEVPDVIFTIDCRG